MHRSLLENNAKYNKRTFTAYDFQYSILLYGLEDCPLTETDYHRHEYVAMRFSDEVVVQL